MTDLSFFFKKTGIQGDPLNVRYSLSQKVLTCIKFLFFKYQYVITFVIPPIILTLIFVGETTMDF